MAARIDEHSFYLGSEMPKRRRRKTRYQLDTPKPLPADSAWLLHALARVLHQIADELVRIAGR